MIKNQKSDAAIVISTYKCAGCKDTHKLKQTWSLSALCSMKDLGFDPSDVIIDYAFNGMKRAVAEQCNVDVDVGKVDLDISGCDIP